MLNIRKYVWTLTWMGLFVWSAAAAGGADVTFQSLLKEMTDLETLTKLPSPAFTCKQFSSYDRKSTDPSALRTDNWFANRDRGQHLREEKRNGATEWVLMDAKGPGAIVRFWSANPKDAETVRVYLDGSDKPAVEMLLTEMLGGGKFPFLKPISGERSKGWNSYLPIPYAKHCKVTTSKRDYYYQVNYRTYAAGTKVQSFSMAGAKRNEALVAETAAALAAPTKAFKYSKKSMQRLRYNNTIDPGETLEMETLNGPAAIYRFSCKMIESENEETALRGCLLEITFDGQAEPSVRAPLGDFFGSAPGVNPYQSLPCFVQEDGTMVANWVMPFEKSANVRVTNHTKKQVQLRCLALAAARKWTDDSLYFHAKWRQEQNIPTRPIKDWTYVAIRGKGRFVGDMLHITNPLTRWWGEGDEKIYVDGEDFPSHFGTGTEDYYGYAWCNPALFTHAYHNQPRCDGPGNFGQTCVNRFHILDNIPFTTSFQFDMEIWHSRETRVSMATTSYWYALAGGSDNLLAPEPGELVVPAAPDAPVQKIVKGALEAERLKIINVSNGNANKQAGGISEIWSRGTQLWWTGGKPGDTLTLAIPVRKAGRYEVRAVFTKAVDYGIHEITIGGQKVDGEIDLFNNGVIATPERSLGVFDLKLGENPMTVKIVGANPKAVKKYMFGIDYVLLKPVE